MADKLPSQREPIIDKNGLCRTTWFRYFFTNDLPTLQATLTTQQETINAQALLITELQQAISTIRDLAILNTLTSASEIPDLGRR